MELIRSHKGAISIFLIIMLLPMVTYATIIIDGARVITSRTTIANAGDLAMNAALSEYEQTLEDMYGLFATAASEEDLKMQLKSYFAQTLEGRFYNGQRGDYSTQQLTDDVIDAIFQYEEDSQGIANFIQMKTEEFDFSPVQNSSLANQAIMKRQIVEYMKYKGPVSLASNLFSKLDFLKDSASQTEVLEKKVEYTEKLDTIQDACEAALQALNDYNSAAKDYNDTYGKGKGKVKTIIDNMKKDYQYMSACLLMEKSSELETFSWDDLDITEDKDVNDINSTLDQIEQNLTAEELTRQDLHEMLSILKVTYENSIKSGLMRGLMKVDIQEAQVDPTTQERPYPTIDLIIESEKQYDDTNVPYQDRLDNYVKDLNSISQVDRANGEVYVQALEEHFQKLNEANQFAKGAEGYLIKIRATYRILERLNSLYSSIFSSYAHKYESDYEATFRKYNENASDKDVEDALNAAKKNWTNIQDTNNPYNEFISEYYEFDRGNYEINTVFSKLNNSSYARSVSDFLKKVSDDSIYENSADFYAARAAEDITAYYNCVADVAAKAFASNYYLKSTVSHPAVPRLPCRVT